MIDEEEFRAYMKAAHTSMSNDGQHLSEAEMIAYCRRAMSDADRDAVQAHLVNCDQCIALFRSARDFVEAPGPDDEEVNAAETDEAWRSLLPHLQRTTPVDDAETNVVLTDFSRSRAKKFPGNSLTLALAASLLISFGVLGLLGWRLWQEQQSRRQSQQAALELENKQRELEQRLSQLEHSGADQVRREREQRLAAEAERDQLQSLLAQVQPEQRNVPVYPFRLSFDRGSEEDLSLSFKKGVEAVRLRLFQSKPYEFPEYAIELVDQRGQVVREISRLRPARADGALSVLLRRATLGTGKHKLRLFGRQGMTKKQLGEIGLSITVEQ
jgi:multidrug efflux pump subunit AcrA (membrane-fusion protein)